MEPNKDQIKLPNKYEKHTKIWPYIYVDLNSFFKTKMKPKVLSVKQNESLWKWSEAKSYWVCTFSLGLRQTGFRTKVPHLRQMHTFVSCTWQPDMIPSPPAHTMVFRAMLPHQLGWEQTGCSTTSIGATCRMEGMLPPSVGESEWRGRVGINLLNAHKSKHMWMSTHSP